MKTGPPIFLLVLLSFFSGVTALEAVSEDELEAVEAKGIQSVSNEEDIVVRQDNNNGSVQLTDSAQSNPSNVVVENSAQSAGNMAVNLIGNISSTGTVDIVQTNEQSSDNEVFSSDQDIENKKDVTAEQNNNNASIQIIDSAQSDISAIIVVNSAQSSGNLGMNFANVSGSTVNLNQTNMQTGSNLLH